MVDVSSSEKNFYIALGSKLRLLREEKGWSINEFCYSFLKKTEISLNPNLLGKIERGETRISIYYFFHICNFYNISPNEFFFENANVGKTSDDRNLLNYFIEDPIGKQVLIKIKHHPNKFLVFNAVFIFLNHFLEKFEEIIFQENKVPATSSVLKAASKTKEKEE